MLLTLHLIIIKSSNYMTYIVTDGCIKCKYTDCVEVCPVDCFHEVKEMVIINPDECIDCGVCEPECPIDAIISDIEAEKNPDTANFISINAALSKDAPNITEKREPLPNADTYKDEKNKLDKYMSD